MLISEEAQKTMFEKLDDARRSLDRAIKILSAAASEFDYRDCLSGEPTPKSTRERIMQAAWLTGRAHETMLPAWHTMALRAVRPASSSAAHQD